MTESPREPDDSEVPELVVQLGNQIQRFDIEVDRLQRQEGIIAAGMLKIDRYMSAINAEFQQMKNQIAGITPDGLDPRI